MGAKKLGSSRSSGYLYTPLLFTIYQILQLLAGGSGRVVLFVSATTFTITNNCKQTIYPGILSNAGVSPLPTTGFILHAHESRTITPPSNWAGRFWARTHCSNNASTATFTCLTGDCGSGTTPSCTSGAAPPATLAEFTLSGDAGLDFYDVSLVDGYNLPVVIVPRGGSGANCTATGCVADLNGSCPADLSVAGEDDGAVVVACRSACERYGKPEFCCSGEFGTPDKCQPSKYSVVFKKACPTAYSYAYDDRTSTFTCGGGADYTITFCPEPSTSQKATSSSSSSSSPDGPATTTSSPSATDVTASSMVYVGALDVTSGASRRRAVSISSSAPYKWTTTLLLAAAWQWRWLLSFHFF